MRWAAVDFETATHDRASACALGVVVVEDGHELYRQAWLIRPPGNDYFWRNVQVHGIRPEDTEDAPEFPHVWAEAMAMIGDRPLVAHNAPFDVGVIRGCCDLFSMPVPERRYYCTVQIARKTWPELSAYKLPIVAGHVGAELQHHDALSDAAACSKILSSSLAHTGSASLAALAELHELREKLVHAP
ncbi:MAG: polymerase epsilon-like protein [Thermoleophilia bacterium]|jgi:DNA polymerase-3 subunit epsilon|nr:polymerase epsilon-like protein [Thermoleophilia bacterium]